ncbi:MAG TPA: metal-dependent hydrolase [Thermoanaerobaculia bacterium]|nr:metal-dependent hydrolase [Thermoanaerobaculia bacterium]
MDTLTHGIAGSVLGRSLTNRPGARAAMLVGAAAAMLPDLDFLYIGSRLDYLKEHRGWTHSFLVMPVLSLAVALVAKVFAKRARLTTLWLFAAVGVTSHIVFDWITSFGTMFWTPFSRVRHSLDWVFILDPWFTGVVLAALVLSLIYRDRGRAIAAAGSAVLAAYIGFCAAMHARALEAWKRLDAPPPGARAAVLPQFLSPFRWLGLTERPGSVDVAFFDVGPFARDGGAPRMPKKWSEVVSSLRASYPPPDRATVKRFERPADSAVLEAARALPDIEVYLAFARFPLETVTPTGDGGAEVVVQDLRFLPWFTGPWERGGEEGLRRQPFVYRVRFDGALRLVERGFIREGRQ